MLSRSLSCLALPLALGLLSPVVGCSGSATSEPAASAPETTMTRGPVAQTSVRGPLKVVADALGDVPLTASQRTAIERLAADTEARHADARAARRALVLAVAGQVEAGQVDRAAVQPAIDALAAALDKAQPADRAAFEQLHGMLTPAQRTTFVDALEARVTERAGKMHDAHPLKQWAAELQLSDDQKAQIRDALKERWQAGPEHPAASWGEARQQGAKVMAAFKQERFVMDEVAPSKDAGAKARRMAEHFLRMAEAAVPVLTPQQRALAAQKLRDRAESTDEVAPGMP
jgi:Spy/CpxP family protein refolding chaperone